MDARDEITHEEDRPRSASRLTWSGRVVWAIGLLTAVLIAALAFGAYRQPELLLNLMGLRYCG